MTWKIRREALLDAPAAAKAAQGIASDGAHYYITWTTRIEKYDRRWNLVASNSDPVADVNDPELKHVSASAVKDGLLYAPMASWPHRADIKPKMTVWDTDDLSLVDVLPLATDASAACCWDSTAHRWYLVGFWPGSEDHIDSYTAEFSYLGPISLSQPIPHKQGITVYRDSLYITGGDGDEKGIWKATRNGFGVTAASLARPGGNEVEGVCADIDSLLAIWRQPDQVFRYTKTQSPGPPPPPKKPTGPPGEVRAPSSYEGPTRYGFLVADPVTDRPYGTIELSDVTFSKQVSATGSMSATVPLIGRGQIGITRTMNSRPCALHVTRQEAGYQPELWWSGIVWTCSPTKGSGHLQADLRAATLDSYTAMRRLWSSVTYSKTDDTDVYRELWRRLQGGPNAGLLVEVPDGPTSGNVGDYTYHAYDDATYADILDDLSTGAFEWTIDTWLDPTSGRHRSLRIGAPTLGRSNLTHLLTDPGNVTGWTFPGDNTRYATQFRARGNTLKVDGKTSSNVGQERVPIVSEVAQAQQWIDRGLPRMDVATDVDTDSIDRLNRKARQMRDAAVSNVRVPQVSAVLPQTSLNANSVGDFVRFMSTDPWFGGELDVTWRIIGMTVHVPDRNRGETVDLAVIPTGEIAEGDAA